MTKKIFRAIMIVASTVLLASFVIMMAFLYNYFGGVQESQLKDELGIVGVAVEESGIDYLEQLDSEKLRITWIAADGSVLFDTQYENTELENHADREEIQEALQSGTGQSTRYSSTLLEQTIYSAKLLSDGTVLRISISRATAGGLAFGMIPSILIVLVVALVLSILLANRISKRIVDPLNNLDLDKPLENDTYEELSPLLGRLNQQQQALATQVQLLRHQQDEFNQITGNMKEGLVLLDGKGAVVSINPTACSVFDTNESCIGKDFLTIERSSDVSNAIETAFTDGHSEIRVDHLGRIFQFDISRIESEGAVIGAVLLAFDVSEQEFAERNRREFTANVSHELKTPLQSIIGSADLIENDLVKPEDLPRFVGNIKQEAVRLVMLIDDIIRLSLLDEGSDLPKEEVELLGLAEEVVVNLHDVAEAKNVQINVDGDDFVLLGVRRLLYEVIFNLVDNAVKYNVEGGSVDISISSDDKNAIVTVRDTGIGIPEEHQNRVFERFYRVDKSHSKTSGGTGLGLSIVKHAVQYHHGKIDFRSKPGEGTEIRVEFPIR